MIREQAGLNIEAPAPAHKPPQASGGTGRSSTQPKAFAADDPSTMTSPGGSLYLGCLHESLECEIDGTKIKGVIYNMESYLRSCITLYEESLKKLRYTNTSHKVLGANGDILWTKVTTPYVASEGASSEFDKWTTTDVPVGCETIRCHWCRMDTPLDRTIRENLKRLAFLTTTSPWSKTCRPKIGRSSKRHNVN